jgi:hypothetical protein
MTNKEMIQLIKEAFPTPESYYQFKEEQKRMEEGKQRCIEMVRKLCEERRKKLGLP